MKWLTIVFFVFIVLVIILADAGKLGFLDAIYNIPRGDKVAHFILFGILAFLLDMTFFQALPHLNRILVAVAIGLILALPISLEEYSQKFFPARTFSFKDLFAGYIGVIFFSWLALIVKKKQSLSK